MEKKQKGFIVGGIIAIIALVLIAGGAYYLNNSGFKTDCCHGEQYIQNLKIPASIEGNTQVSKDENTYAFGDINNDGSSDVAVIITSSSEGTGTFYYLATYDNSNSDQKYLASIYLGDRIKINKISIENGIITTDIITQGPNEPMCCGTLRKIVKYKLQGYTLVQIDEVTISDNLNGHDVTGDVLINAESIEEGHFAKVDITDWKTQSIPELGIEFKYPLYLGDAIIKKTDRTACPQMKSYQPELMLPSQDYLVTFSNDPKVGVGGSRMRADIKIASTENNTKYCDADIATLGSLMTKNSEYIKYTKWNSGRVNIQEEYVSELFTALGTSLEQYYSIFVVKRNIKMLIQPIMTFIPYAYTNEWKEIEVTGDVKKGDIVKYVKESPNAAQIRSYFKDFEALQASIKITN